MVTVPLLVPFSSTLTSAMGWPLLLVILPFTTTKGAVLPDSPAAITIRLLPMILKESGVFSSSFFISSAAGLFSTLMLTFCPAGNTPSLYKKRKEVCFSMVLNAFFRETFSSLIVMFSCARPGLAKDCMEKTQISSTVIFIISKHLITEVAAQ